MIGVSNSLYVLPAISYTLLQVFGSTGNVLLIHTIYTQRRLQTNYYYLVYHLAISDLVVLLSVVDKTWYFWSPGSPLINTVVCKVLFLPRLMCYISGDIFLTFIGLLRYRKIFHPLLAPISSKKLRCVIALSYLVSLLVSSSYLVVSDVEDGKCVLQDHRYKLYNIATALAFSFFSFLLPLVLLPILYSKIIWGLWLQQRKFVRLIEPQFTVVSENDASPNEFQIHERRRRSMRASLVSVAVVVLFALSSAPNEISWFIATTVKQTATTSLPWWLWVVKLAGTCAVNPIIYGIGDSALRQSCKRNVWKIAAFYKKKLGI